MQEKNGNQIPTAFEALVPEIYMPRLQFFIRILLGTLSALYFNFIPIPPLILSVTQINLIIVSYYAFHVFWWWYYQRYGSKIIHASSGFMDRHHGSIRRGSLRSVYHSSHDTAVPDCRARQWNPAWALYHRRINDRGIHPRYSRACDSLQSSRDVGLPIICTFMCCLLLSA